MQTLSEETQRPAVKASTRRLELFCHANGIERTVVRGWSRCHWC